ncbi:MAG: hypothetical protein LIP11_16110 [Clostridiales bacterium]|nr:hypothetical protein [Clostridiales bacterium]
MFTVLLSALISLVISASYYKKGNRDNLKMSVVYPMLEILQDKNYSGENNDKFHHIVENYCVRYFSKKERATFLELFNQYQFAVGYHEHELQSKLVFDYMINVIKKEKAIDVDKRGWYKVEKGEKQYLDLGWSLSVNWEYTAVSIIRSIDHDVPAYDTFSLFGYHAKKYPDGTPILISTLVIEIIKKAFYAEKKTINIDDIEFFSNEVQVMFGYLPKNRKPTVIEVANNKDILEMAYQEKCGEADKLRENFLKLKIVKDTIEMFPQFKCLTSP